MRPAKITRSATPVLALLLAALSSCAADAKATTVTIKPAEPTDILACSPSNDEVMSEIASEFGQDRGLNLTLLPDDSSCTVTVRSSELSDSDRAILLSRYGKRILLVDQPGFPILPGTSPTPSVGGVGDG